MLSFPVIVLFVFKVESKVFQQRNPISIVSSVLTTIAIIFNISIRQPKYDSSRVLFAFIVMYGIIHSSVLQSTLYSNLNRHIEVGRIYRLDQLLDKNYELSINEKMYGLLKNGDGTRMLRKLRDLANSAAKRPANLLGEIVSGKNRSAVLVSDMFAFNYLDRYYDNITKKNIFYRVPEFVVQYYTSVITPKSSPFQERFSDIIKGFVEFGFAEYQLRRAYRENNKIMINRVKTGEVPGLESKTITLAHISSIFFIYLILNALSITVFFLEHLRFWWGKRKIKNKIKTKKKVSKK